jgi:hypothetical protein
MMSLGLLALVLAVMPPPSAGPDVAGVPEAGKTVATPPLSFIPNRGQTDASVRYYAQGPGYGFYFTDDKAVLALRGTDRGHALELRFLGASSGASLRPAQRGPGTVNYLEGDDPNRWQTGLPTYDRLAYRGLWPGVDMSFRGADRALKYEFTIAPGANPGRIRLAYAGAQGLSLSESGSLLIKTPQGTLRDSAPRAWQRINGRRVPVRSRYSLGKGTHAYGFELGSYDRGHPLVIDPGLRYSTYVGGSAVDAGEDIAVDSSGNAYITGRADSSNFPTTPGAFDVTHGTSSDAFVSKVSDDGSTLIYSTFLGGNAIDSGYGIALDGAGSAYVTGNTSSSNFPTTVGALDTALNGNEDGFVAKLAADGSALSYSTYLGGTGNIDSGNAITVDDTGHAYVTGDTISTDFPTTPGAFDTSASSIYTAFVSKLDPTGSSLDYSTYLGGSGTFDFGNAIAVDGTGGAYVTGSTSSTNFPTTVGAYDTTQNGDDDAFVTKLSADGSTLDYSTFLGGNTFDGSSAIALGAGGTVYLGGGTSSTDFPATAGAFDTSFNGDGDGFVAKLNAAGSALSYSTFLGGAGSQTTGQDTVLGIAVDASGNANVAGRTASATFPTTSDAYDPVIGPLSDAFYTKLNPTGSALLYSTYLGGATGGTGGSDEARGIALDGAGDAYIVGDTASSDFPVTAGAYDSTLNGSYDAFVAKIGASGYARPRSATPLILRFVPAYESCGTSNAAHGAPLAVPSCSPPQPASAYLTVGTPDANGEQPNASAKLLLKVVGESPVNPGNGDQGDVELVFTMTDVRNSNDLTDYTGELQVATTLRMTDRYNGASQADAATVVDIPFSFTVPCVPTDETNIGSTCSVTTSADSVMSDLVREGKRTIWELGQTTVYDGGADGDADSPGNTLFFVQGVFAP